MKQGAGHRRQDTGNGQPDRHGEHAQREDQVLLDRPDGLRIERSACASSHELIEHPAEQEQHRDHSRR